jgi:tetratricopeptide (TPR) repeat protein
MGLFDEALLALEHCEDNAQNRFEMLYLKAMVYKAKEDYDKSKGVLSALSALSSLTISQFIGTHYELALAHEALSETDQAIVELEKVVMLDPTFGDAADRLARLRSSIGLGRSFPKEEGSP